MLRWMNGWMVYVRVCVCVHVYVFGYKHVTAKHIHIDRSIDRPADTNRSALSNAAVVDAYESVDVKCAWRSSQWPASPNPEFCI